MIIIYNDLFLHYHVLRCSKESEQSVAFYLCSHTVILQGYHIIHEQEFGAGSGVLSIKLNKLKPRGPVRQGARNHRTRKPQIQIIVSMNVHTKRCRV